MLLTNYEFGYYKSSQVWCGRFWNLELSRLRLNTASDRHFGVAADTKQGLSGTQGLNIFCNEKKQARLDDSKAMTREASKVHDEQQNNKKHHDVKELFI